MQMGQKSIAVHIFPSLGLTLGMLRRVSILFGRPAVYLPWQMELPFEKGDSDDQKAFEIIRPTETMRPPEYFPRLLTEYRTWMRYNPGRTDSALLAAAQQIPNEDTRWEIQEMVRKGTRVSDVGKSKDLALKWHLLLHLAAAMEKEAGEAEDTLRRLKDQDSPLKEALGEDSGASDLMGDLSDSLVQPVIEDYLLENVCEAWLGLFGEFIKREALLVTLDEKIEDYVKGIFEETTSEIGMVRPISRIHLRVPDPLNLSSRGPAAPDSGDLQKELPFLTQRIIRGLREKDNGDLDEVNALVAAIEEKFRGQSGLGMIRVDIVSLPVITGPHSAQGQVILNGLEGKSLASVREVSNHE